MPAATSPGRCSWTSTAISPRRRARRAATRSPAPRTFSRRCGPPGSATARPWSSMTTPTACRPRAPGGCCATSATEQVALLDGGLSAWLAAGRPLADGDETPQHQGDFTARPGAMPVLDADGAARLAAHRGPAGRARPRALPRRERADGSGGRSHPGRPQLADGPQPRRPRAASCPPASCAEALGGLTGGAAVGAYCGSGITAAHTVLALELAGHRGGAVPGLVERVGRRSGPAGRHRRGALGRQRCRPAALRPPARGRRRWARGRSPAA